MKKINKFLFVGLFALMLFGCSKKTTKDNKTSSNTTTENKNLCTIKFDLNNGEGHIDDVVVEKGGKIEKPTEPTRKGYTFNGWYYEGEEWSFVGYSVTEDMTLVANWVLDKYSITLNNEVEGLTISGVTSGDKYDHNSEITLTASNIPSGKIIKWSRSDGVEFIGSTYKFNLPDENITITTTTVICYTREGNKIYFGTYPQTYVTDDTLVSELNTLAGNLPSSDNLYNWSDYNYYLAENVASYMFYQDIDYDNNGTYDYRGVYFTAYRPKSHLANAAASYQSTNGYSTNTVYWFNYDPIEWNIITESDGKATLLANLILDSQHFQVPSHSDAYRNNYEKSEIRQWLNNDFYNTAFKSYEKSIIQLTAVDNSLESTNQSENDYVCNDTEDYVFLLSHKEAVTYMTSNSARQAKGSDYAKAQGLYCNNGYSFWWLRSPFNDYNYTANFVDEVGKVRGGGVYYSHFGVRPAICIEL